MERLIIAVTNDQYELPVAIAKSCYELAKIMKVKECTVYSAFKKKAQFDKRQYRIIEVMVEEDIQND